MNLFAQGVEVELRLLDSSIHEHFMPTQQNIYTDLNDPYFESNLTKLPENQRYRCPVQLSDRIPKKNSNVSTNEANNSASKSRYQPAPLDPFPLNSSVSFPLPFPTHCLLYNIIVPPCGGHWGVNWLPKNRRTNPKPEICRMHHWALPENEFRFRCLTRGEFATI